MYLTQSGSETQEKTNYQSKTGNKQTTETSIKHDRQTLNMNEGKHKRTRQNKGGRKQGTTD